MELTPYILGWAVPAILSAIVGYLAGLLRKLTARDKAIEKGLRCILRGEITRAYQRHIIDGRPMTLECRRQLDKRPWALLKVLVLIVMEHEIELKLII